MLFQSGPKTTGRAPNSSIWRPGSTRSTAKSRTRCGIWVSPQPKAATASGRRVIGQRCETNYLRPTAGVRWCNTSSTRCVDLDAGPRAAAGSAGRRIVMSLAPGLCLVTGATGFVGSAVTRALLKAGHRVRVLARPQSDRRNLKGLAVEIAEGSLENAGSLAAAAAGCRYLFHVAADYRLWVPDPAPMFRINVAGTRELMLAAAGAGVERIVYTSSVATLGIVK